MAFNEISLPTWQNLVRRVFGLTGGGGNVPLLAPELQPVVVVQPDVPEYALLRGEIPMITNFNVAAGGAGNLSAGQVRNIADSGRLIIIDRVQWNAVGGVRFAFAFNAVDLPSIISPDAMVKDVRRFTPGTQFIGAARLSQQNVSGGAALGSILTAQFSQQSGSTGGFVLPPNWGFILQTTNNVALQATLEWRERALENMEAEA